MIKLDLSESQIADYFRRSYTAVDGLWFLKVEERYGFETALQIDEEVWKVLPKIQARMIKNMLSLESGIDDLFQGVAARLRLEGFSFKGEREDEGFAILVTGCPWHDLMIRSGREHLSDQVGELICQVENSVWAKEFGDIEFQRSSQICRGDSACLLRFTEALSRKAPSGSA
jgi:predicted ArsR family transcriptional regulator